MFRKIAEVVGFNSGVTSNAFPDSFFNYFIMIEAQRRGQLSISTLLLVQRDESTCEVNVEIAPSVQLLTL